MWLPVSRGVGHPCHLSRGLPPFAPGCCSSWWVAAQRSRRRVDRVGEVRWCWLEVASTPLCGGQGFPVALGIRLFLLPWSAAFGASGAIGPGREPEANGGTDVPSQRHTSLRAWFLTPWPDAQTPTAVPGSGGRSPLRRPRSRRPLRELLEAPRRRRHAPRPRIERVQRVSV